MVGVTALLELARWGRQRRHDIPGQSPWRDGDRSVPPACTPARDAGSRSRLWGELPAQARHDALDVLSRMVAQRLPTPPAKPEVPHENP